MVGKSLRWWTTLLVETRPDSKSKFELKFKEISMSWNRGKFTEKSWNFGFQWNSVRKLLATPYYQEKSFSIKRGSESWIPLEMGNSIDFTIVWTINFIFNYTFWFRLILAPNYLLMTLIKIFITRGGTIYPSWPVFIKLASAPPQEKHRFFSAKQSTLRKDV
jgi:hypothetical protein